MFVRQFRTILLIFCSFSPKLPLIVWLQYYARSDWLLRGQGFLVMTWNYANFSRLDGSFEWRVKTTSAWAKTTQNIDEVQLYFQ